MNESFHEKVINAILQQDPDLTSHFGDLVAQLLFQNGEMALLIDKDNRQSQLLYSQCSGFKQAFLSFSDALATVSALETEGLVFIQTDEQEDAMFLFYEGKKDFTEAQIPNEYNVNETTILQYTSFSPAVLKDEQSLFGNILPDVMYYSIERVFTGRIYPTKELESYVARSYRTREQQIAHRSLVVAWIAIVVAIIIGLLPFISGLIKGTNG